MNPADLLARCAASIADDKKHGLTYRTCRAEDFEALVERAALLDSAEKLLRDWNTGRPDAETTIVLAKIDAARGEHT